MILEIIVFTLVFAVVFGLLERIKVFGKTTNVVVSTVAAFYSLLSVSVFKEWKVYFFSAAALLVFIFFSLALLRKV